MAAFVGTEAVPPAVIARTLSADLDGAALPDPSDEAWHLVGQGPSSGVRGPANPVPATTLRPGARAPAHDLSWFERIHVVPRQVDLAFVISEQTVQVEVWNAFRAAARTLTAIDIVGSAGLSVDSPPTLPLHVPATDSRVYVLRASTLGDPAIANVVTWVLTGIDPEGTDVTLTGSRLVPFPFAADFRESLTERISHLTQVMEAESGAEQRRQLREWPRRGLSFLITLPEARHAQHASALLYSWADGGFGVPLWQYSSRLTADAGVGASTLALDTTDLPFAAGGFALLWRDPFTWEAVTIDAVSPTGLGLMSPIASAWTAAGTHVLPLAIGRLEPGAPLRWLTLDIGVSRVAFTLEASA